MSSFYFILVTVLLDAIGIGLVLPILPALLKGLTGGGEDTARMFGLFISAYALMQFIASPVLGALSDRFGRRPVLLVSLFGAGIDYLIMAFAGRLDLLFVGRVVSGLTGASMTVASSYISDTSDESNRAARFGYVNAAFGLGFIIGPIIGGYLGEISTRLPFIAAALMNLANFAFGAFVLRESLTPEMRRKVEVKRLNPFRSLHWALRAPELSALIIVLFVYFLAQQVPMTLWTLDGAERFGWDTKMIGWSFAAYGAAMAMAQGSLTGPASQRLGPTVAVTLGFVLEAACFVGLALATQSWMVFAIIVPLCIASIAGPALQAQLSGFVGPTVQGELQGTIVSLMSFASIIGPIVASQVYVSVTGRAYVLAAVLCLVAGALNALAQKRRSSMQVQPVV